MSFVYERPDADIIDGEWRDQAQGQTLFDKVDESSDSPADYDTEYIISAPNPSNDMCRLRLSDQAATTPANVRYRYAKQGDIETDFTVRLKQSDTTIQEFFHADISTSLTTVTQQLDP